MYELLTGRRPFDGTNATETLANVLKSQPDWAALPHDTPPAIRTLLQKCLEKDRARRMADAAIATFLLDEAWALASSPAPARSSPATEAAHRVRRHVPILLATLVSAIVTGSSAWLLLPPSSPSPPVVRLSFPVPSGQTLSGIARHVLTISPDGTSLV